MNNAPPGQNTFQKEPSYSEKFNVTLAQETIDIHLKEILADAQYNPEQTPALTKQLSDEIKDKMKQLGHHSRYKLAVHVVIGEHRAQGVRMAARQFWDSKTDRVASCSFQNGSLFCCATVHAVYQY